MISNASCNKCAFFDDHAVNGTQSAQNGGLCRFNPPISQPGPTEHGLWPVVSDGDWCGHFAASQSASQIAAE